MEYPPLVVASAGDEGGSGFYRIVWPLVVADLAGVIQLKMPQGFGFLDPTALQAMKPDAMLFHKCHTDQQLKYLRKIADTSAPLMVYTIDDWIEKVPKDSPHFAAVDPEVGKAIRKAVRMCDRLIVSNELLATQYGYKKETVLIPNYLPFALWQEAYKTVKPAPRSTTKARIGWSGGINHLPDLVFLREIADLLGDEVEWVFLGATPAGFSYDNSEIIRPVRTHDYPAALLALDLDLALAPMLDNDFNRARTDLKVLEYGAAGYSVICSDIAPYEEICDEAGVPRLKYDAKIWADVIRYKIAHLSQTHEQGLALKEWVWEHRKMEDHVGEYSKALSPDGKGFQPIIAPVSQQVDVVVTAYKNQPVLERCINSVLAAKNVTKTELVIVDDGAEPAIVSYLTKLRDEGVATIVSHITNLGYVRAVNTGIKLHPDRDVVILNSDTVVNGNWIDRLRADCYDRPRTASVTPFTNQGTICSYPNVNGGSKLDVAEAQQFDELAKEVNLKPAPIPLPVGFCTYLSREVLNDVGLFDAHGFGRGYGEENDWGFRAGKRHWNHYLGSNVYVGHESGVVFKDERQQLMQTAAQVISMRWQSFVKVLDEWMQKNPLIPIRSKLDITRAGRTKGRILILTHLLQGGIELFLREELTAFHRTCFIGRPDPSRTQLMHLETLVPEFLNLPSVDVRANAELAAELFRSLGITRIQVHSLVGFDGTMPQWLTNVVKAGNFELTAYLHDYFMLCPRARLASTSLSYCGEPDSAGCNDCITANSSYAGYVEIDSWRETYHRFLVKAKGLIAPTHDVAERYLRYYPDLNITVKPHDRVIYPLSSQIAQPCKPGERLRVVSMGLVNPEKGARVLYNCAKYCLENNLPVDFVVIGLLLTEQNQATSYQPLANLSMTGMYEEHNIYSLLQEAKANLAFFPGVIPESYSRTLTHALRASLYPVAFDLGAIAERIREFKYGELISYEEHDNPAAIVNALFEAATKARPFTGLPTSTNPAHTVEIEARPAAK